MATMLGHQTTALVGLLWTALSVSGLVAMGRNGQIVGVLVVLVFVGIGIFMLAMPLIEYQKAKSTLFAITDERFLMLTGGGRSIRSVRRSAIRQVERVSKWGGVTLRIPTALISDNDGGQKTDYTELHGLPDAERAYRLLTQPVT